MPDEVALFRQRQAQASQVPQSSIELDLLQMVDSDHSFSAFERKSQSGVTTSEGGSLGNVSSCFRRDYELAHPNSFNPMLNPLKAASEYSNTSFDKAQLSAQ
jgi:hypothetical protein